MARLPALFYHHRRDWSFATSASNVDLRTVNTPSGVLEAFHRALRVSVAVWRRVRVFL